MKVFRTIIAATALLYTANTFAQTEEVENSTSYRADLFGSVATGSNTPFWMVSNRYGIVPLEANNGYLNAGIFHQQYFGKGFRWSAGLDLVAVAPRYKNIYIQQVYAELGYKSLLLSVGSKESHKSLWDNTLSSGDIVISHNARPIPEINLSMPEFTVIPKTKGWMQVKWDFAVGRSFDTKYLEHFANEHQTYIKNVLWHHKSLYIQIKDTKNGSPFSGIIGVQHWAQWGGTSTNPYFGKQPQSFKDFIRTVLAREGGDDSSEMDQLNVLGNHYGSYDFKLQYTQPNWTLSAYYQHYFEDKSGMTFGNGTDGLWGIQLDLPQFPWLRKVVTEYLITRDQSGPFHFIDFDHSVHKGPGGGNDNYYNNGEYVTGVSYFNRGIGSPLLTSPEYNKDGTLGFKNNRVRAWYLGAEGDLSPQVSYRFMMSISNSWGTHSAPFLNNKRGASGMIDIKYRHPKLTGWEFTGSVAGDTGSLYGKNLGFSLSVCKRGILKNWGITQ